MYRYDFCTIWRGGWVNVNDGGGRGRTPDNYVEPARGWWHGAWCWYAKSTGLYPIIEQFWYAEYNRTRNFWANRKRSFYEISTIQDSEKAEQVD